MLYLYNNIYIYAGSYKYLKEKKNSNGRLKGKKKKKKKKNAVVTVATVPLNNPKWHCNNGLKLKKDGKKKR